MKKMFLLLAGVLMVCTAGAQVLEHDESALVYYSPKTVLVLDFTYTVETQERGQFADFAEAMLGATDIVTENASRYTLKDVQIRTATIADTSRPHKVGIDGGIPLLLHINEKGLLTGYNLPTAAHNSSVYDTQKSNEPENAPKKRSSKAAPFPEEVLEAATPLAQAHAVAKQIFHLRETRMYLLSGEVEHAPADGEAMKQVLDELDRQEKALTELFVGKKSKKLEHQKVTYSNIDIDRTSDATRTNRLSYKYPLYFSEENGFTDEENIEAEAIVTTVTLSIPYYKFSPKDGKAKKKENELSPIVYNLPGTGDIEVAYRGKKLAVKTVQLAQLGLDVPLPKSLFTGNELPQIVISEKTGNIISISK